jgi:hypothetical protein
MGMRRVERKREVELGYWVGRMKVEEVKVEGVKSVKESGTKNERERGKDRKGGGEQLVSPDNVREERRERSGGVCES